ncbi:MAG: DUF3300 domain-containing protein [Firmicutes bacterium]|nr:DUF3300 domain-containing protein [Bacillota bacterium]
MPMQIMKSRQWRISVFLIILAAVVLLPCAAMAQTAANNSTAQKKLSGDQLDQLTAPIALYPDDVLAQILPASTVPLEIVEAYRYLQQNNNKVDKMPDTDWDPSVKALLKFPSVLKQMNDNLDWTQALGYAVAYQQSDVMASIQRVRKKTYDAGNLKSNDKQQVVVENNYIEVQPSDPQVIYVPEYDTANMYQPNYGAALFSFAAGIAVGEWIDYRNFDWYHNTVIIHPDYFHYYNYHPWQNNWRWNDNYIHRGYPAPPPWQPSPVAKNNLGNYMNNSHNVRVGNTTVNINNSGNKGNIINNQPVGNRTVNNRPIDNNQINKTNVGNRIDNNKPAMNFPSNVDKVKTPTMPTRDDNIFGGIKEGRSADMESRRGSFSRGGFGGGGGGGFHRR